MGDFKDHPSKKIIREQWCKPLIKFVYDALNCKLIYLGLPGTQAIDIFTWIEYIDQIIAFQCRDYPKPSSVSQSKAKVQELETKLLELERQGKISNFVLYDGFMEEVILRGKDTEGRCFNQNDVVTIYNLDFCNAITTPLLVPDDKGNLEKYYKSGVIKKLLEIQRDISSSIRCKKFIMFLTIHSNFMDDEQTRFIAQNKDKDIKIYVNSLKGLTGLHKTLKLLKAYMYQIINNFFCHCDFTPEILPVITYCHDGNWLVHFTIIGTLNKQASALSPCLQNPNDFFSQKFLTIKNSNLKPLSINGAVESDCSVNLVNAFQDSPSYKELWLSKKK